MWGHRLDSNRWEFGPVTDSLNTVLHLLVSYNRRAPWSTRHSLKKNLDLRSQFQFLRKTWFKELVRIITGDYTYIALKEILHCPLNLWVKYNGIVFIINVCVVIAVALVMLLNDAESYGMQLMTVCQLL